MNPISRRERRRFLCVSASAVAGVYLGGSATAIGQSTIELSNERLFDTNGNTQQALGIPVDSAAVLQTYHFSGIALGAQITLDIVHSDQRVAAGIANDAFAEVGRLEQLFSLYRTDSTLVELNNRGTLDMPPPEMLSIFSLASGVWRATEGTFDPTVQPHWQMRHQVAGKRRVFSWKDVSYSASSIGFRHPEMAITLNGIAQGYISDQIASLLRKRGLHDVLVNMGEIVAMGTRSDGQAWQVGVAELQNGTPTQTVAMSDIAMATSAPLSTADGHQAAEAHIIDPATGRPCESSWRWVSVIHPSAALADALSTGLVMKSIEGVRKVIEQYPDARVLLSDSNGHLHTVRGSG